ncbi:MAG: hypothetical protein IJO88_06675 [Oscillospiraceae bacterium]|nr:hypothetical protein [Oscillospiraceae bacterium]
MARRFLSTSDLPERPKTKSVFWERLDGGLNLSELDYRMALNESPEMENLWWRDGLLGCRDGQEYTSETPLGRGLCCCDRPYWGYMIAHIGDSLYAAKPGSVMELKKLCGGLAEARGTFVPYRDALIYKCPGSFKRILWDGSALTAEDVEGYVPVIAINCAPATGSGDLYQPENRLSPKKICWYNAARTTHSVSFTGARLEKSFTYKTQDDEPVCTVEQVYVDTALQDPSEYTLSEDKLTVTLSHPLSEEGTITVVYTVGVRTFKLPVEAVDSIVAVTVDDAEVTDYETDLENSTVTFLTAPAVADPPVNNTVKITYSKENREAYDAIMDCAYAAAYGGTGNAVLVMAGSKAQPNACFWNGSHVAMDMGYFPMDYYDLAGNDLEAVTGFGQQAGYLMVFKERSIGKCLLSTTTIGERAYLTLTSEPVSVSMGCDLPWTIRTVENNLVWCSTYAGVCRLDDTNEAMENRVRCISRKILGHSARPGLLEAVREAGTVCALDDGQRYWVVADGRAYLWDYKISSASKPGWFYFTNIPAVAFCRADTVAASAEDGFDYTGAAPIYHLDKEGRISRFIRTFRDYGGPIRKCYCFAACDFGTLERQKHIRKIVLASRCDTDSVLRLQYLTDLGVRDEPTPIRAYSYRLLPRDLSFRFLGVRRFAHTAVRVPGCRYVRWFSIRMENDEAGCDLSPVSAEVFADLVVKER